MQNTIGQKLSGEECILGEFGFGREAQRYVDTANRELLIELCTGLDYVVPNTLYPDSPELKVTYHEAKAAR